MTAEDVHNALADVLWWIKGFAHCGKDGECPFDATHLEALRLARIEFINKDKETTA